MSDFTGIAGVCLSIQQLLSTNFAQSEPLPGTPTRVVIARAADLVHADSGGVSEPTLALFASRIVVNNSMRTTRGGFGTQDGRSFLPINVHFLLIPFANNAESEYRIVGRAVECLETNPVLSGTMLAQGTAWTSDEAIQVVVEDLSQELMVHLLEAIGAPFRMAIPYLARGLRLESAQTPIKHAPAEASLKR